MKAAPEKLAEQVFNALQPGSVIALPTSPYLKGQAKTERASYPDQLRRSELGKQ